MGAKTWMLVYANGDAREILKSRPGLDREATLALANRLFPNERLEPLEDGCLTCTNPPDGEIVIGCFPGVAILAAKEAAVDRPSGIDPALVDPALGTTIYSHAMHSVVDWFAFSVRAGGKLLRSFSVSPDSEIMEDIGAKLPFEAPFWAGERPAIDPEEEDASDYPLPFHPLEMGEAALLELFGYQLEGPMIDSALESDSVPLMRFKRRVKPGNRWWKFW